MADDREQMIRDRAYSIWEEQGRPHGEDMRHWLQAWQELAEEEPGSPDGKSSDTVAPAVMAEPVEKRVEKIAAPQKGARKKRS